MKTENKEQLSKHIRQNKKKVGKYLSNKKLT